MVYIFEKLDIALSTSISQKKFGAIGFSERKHFFDMNAKVNLEPASRSTRESLQADKLFNFGRSTCIFK